MYRALFLLPAVVVVLLALPAAAGEKGAPEKIVGVGLDHKSVKEALAGSAIACSGKTSKKTKICRVTPYKYLGDESSPEGASWGRVDEEALVVETIGKDDLILSAGVAWSVKEKSGEEPVRARFLYLSQELEKSFGPPTAVTPPALGSIT